MVGQLLNWFGDNLPWTRIGRAVNEQRERAQMHQYRNQLMQRQQQEWDTQQSQLKAAQNVFTPGTPPPSQIPVTPPVGSPGYDQARQQLDQTNIGAANPVDYLKGPASAIAQGLAQAGQFNTAGQVLKEGIPQEPWKYGTVNGMMGQIEPGSQRFHPFPQGAAGKDSFQQMTPDELRQWGFPEGTVAAMNKVTGKPDVIYRPDIRERSDLEQRTQQAGFYVLDNGQMVAGEFTPNRGVGYRNENGELVPLPQGARPGTPSMGGYLNPNQFLTRRNEFIQEQQALRRLNDYGRSVGGMETGIRNWASSVTAKFRTLLGSKELNPQEFARMTGEGQLQALLGLFRTDVVGPGVMTEYDAQRVMQALGGNVGALQNPQVVERLLRDIYTSKMERVRLLESEINRNAPVFQTERMSVTAPENFTGTGAPTAPDGGGLTAEEQAELEQLRKELGGR